MYDYLRRAGKTILIIIIVVCVVSIAKNLAEQRIINAEPEIVYIQDPLYVQPPCEAQRRLKEQGLYDGRIDGIWGEKTDKAFCDYMAIRAIEGK